MKFVSLVLATCYLFVIGAGAFVPPSTFSRHSAKLNPIEVGSSEQVFRSVTQTDSAMESVVMASSSVTVSAMADILQTVAIVIGAGVALLFGLAFLASNVLLPQAAQQLEDETREKYPDMWQEISSRLGPDETLRMRPDLIQEYGQKFQKRLEEDFVRMQQTATERKATTTTSSVTDAANSWGDSSSASPSDVVDVEFTKEEGDGAKK